jgi:CRP-like cAMP-binding protein
MIRVTECLEPRCVPAGTIIFRTVEDVDEIFFINKGAIDIGFEISRQSKYVIRLDKGGVIGIYNVTFDKKTIFIYKVSSMFEGFTIRRENWKNIIYAPEHEDITCFIRHKITEEYHKSIKMPLLKVHKKVIHGLK